jgi:hypothetical protein
VNEAFRRGNGYLGWDFAPLTRLSAPSDMLGLVLPSRARNNIPDGAPSRASWIRVLVMKRKYIGIPLRMDAAASQAMQIMQSD